MDYKQKFDEVVNILNIAFHDDAKLMHDFEGCDDPWEEGMVDAHHPDIVHLCKIHSNRSYMGNTFWWGCDNDYDEVVQDDERCDNTRYFLDDTCIDWKDDKKFRSWWWKQGPVVSGGEHNAGHRAKENTPEQ